MASDPDHHSVAARIKVLSALSAGLAHDLGNLLLPLRFRILEPREPFDNTGDSCATGELEMLVRVTEQLQQITGGLRLLSGVESEGRREGTNLHAWAAEARPILKSALPRGVALQQQIQDDVPPVAIGRSWLTQLIFMILHSAFDAADGLRQSTVSMEAQHELRGPSVALQMMLREPPSRGTASRSQRQPSIDIHPQTIAELDAICRSAGCCLSAMKVPEGWHITINLPIFDQAREQRQRPIHAQISVADQRLVMYLHVLLSSLGIDGEEISPDQVSTHAAAALWIADASEDSRTRALEVVAGADTGVMRKVILLGESGGPTIHSDIIELSRTDLAAVRRTLLKLAPQLESQSVHTVER